MIKADLGQRHCRRQLSMSISKSGQWRPWAVTQRSPASPESRSICHGINRQKKRTTEWRVAMSRASFDLRMLLLKRNACCEQANYTRIHPMTCLSN
eukprot:6172270-Pleurochrysis_carterae.AAC.1